MVYDFLFLTANWVGQATNGKLTVNLVTSSLFCFSERARRKAGIRKVRDRRMYLYEGKIPFL